MTQNSPISFAKISAFLLSTYVILGLSQLLAQDQTSTNNLKPSVWFNFGAGLSAAGDGPETSFGGGATMRAGLGVQLNRWLVHTRFTGNTGGVSESPALFFGYKHDLFVEAALMGGYLMVQNQHLLVTVSTGLSHVSGRRISDRTNLFGAIPEPFDPVLGLPLELGIISRPTKGIKIALYFHGNINREGPFFGATLCGQFGRVRF
jgi:hypothetical protein